MQDSVVDVKSVKKEERHSHVTQYPPILSNIIL